MMKCNDHCGDCPFACHSEVEDGHTPEWLIEMQIRINDLHRRLALIQAGFWFEYTFTVGTDQ